MKNIFSYKKILIILGLCILGLCIVYYLIFSDIKNKNQNISRLENDLSLQTNKQDLVDAMQASLANSSADVASVDSSVVASDGDVAFIEDLESLAKSSNLGISIDSLVLQDDPKLASSSMIFFNIKGKTTGSWSGTYVFLEQLESLPFKVKINSFAVENANDQSGTDAKKNGSNAWQSSFEISVLKYK